MADKMDKIRQFAKALKDKVQFAQINNSGRAKVDQLLTKYVPATKVSSLAEKFKKENMSKSLQELVSRYERFTGVQEIMALQNTVIDAQERFMTAQERRRDLGRELASIEARLKELHADMQNTMKGDEKYLQLCTEEHKLIIQERALRTIFTEAEREERELFATMSAAVKLGHERERAHAERNKYWYIVASIFGTVLGIAGSTINNHLKMAEFRDMMEQQMARSASVLFTMAGGGAASRADITEAMKTEFQYQAQLAQNLKLMQDSINNLVTKQSSVMDYLNHQEHIIETKMHELKKLIVAASLKSAKSDAELAKALQDVHQDLDDDKSDKADKLDKADKMDKADKLDKDKEATDANVSLDSNQILSGIGLLICIAIVFGNIVGRIS